MRQRVLEGKVTIRLAQPKSEEGWRQARQLVEEYAGVFERRPFVSGLSRTSWSILQASTLQSRERSFSLRRAGSMSAVSACEQYLRPGVGRKSSACM